MTINIENWKDNDGYTANIFMIKDSVKYFARVYRDNLLAFSGTYTSIHSARRALKIGGLKESRKGAKNNEIRYAVRPRLWPIQ